MDRQEQEKIKKTCIFQAPLPTHPAIAPSIYWIEVKEGYEVEWQWTQLPDGNKVVTGYKLIVLKNR